jgi:hypothetical protein
MDRLKGVSDRLIIWGWIATLVVSGIVPPWIAGSIPGGYCPIFAPPDTGHIDQYRLTVEWIIVTVFFLGLYVAPPWKSRQRLGRRIRGQY